jgi:hypothetical protein
MFYSEYRTLVLWCITVSLIFVMPFGGQVNQPQSDRLEALIASIQQRWGTAALQPLSALATRPTMPGLLTGFEMLDAVLGEKGIPCGQTTEIIGKLTSGATTLVYKIVAAAQKENQYVIYVDLESTFNPTYAVKYGINLQQLFLARPETELEALDIARDLIQQGSVAVVVLDLGETQPNIQDLRRLAALLSRSGCVVLLLTLAESEANIQTILRSSQAPLRLVVERDVWIRTHQDIRGYRSDVIIYDRRSPSAKRVTIDIDADGDTPT